MTYVYAGKYLRLDLTTGAQRIESIRDEDVRRYYLGSGYAAMLMYREMDPDLPALDPRSPIYIFNGLMSGTFAPTGCRSSWCGRSPLTGIWNESNMGGHWGAELRFAGLDGLVITGRAEKPVYLYVHDGRAEVRDASAMWGMETYDAYDAMLAETDPKARAAVIGPAGENLVHFANIMQGGREHSRAAGRGGMGAVLGSKNVKGIVCRGKDKPAYADPTGFRDRVREDNAFIKEHSMPMSNFGTAGGVVGSEGKGDLPLRNWRDGSWPEGAQRISGPAIHEQMWVKHTFCYACPIGCGKLIEVREGPHAGVRGEGPEYETLAGFGAQLLNDDLTAVAALNDRCARYGLDTISASSVITFAFEAFERGLIEPEEAGGAALEWGGLRRLPLLDLIATREGRRLSGGRRAWPPPTWAAAPRRSPRMSRAWNCPTTTPAPSSRWPRPTQRACAARAISNPSPTGAGMASSIPAGRKARTTASPAPARLELRSPSRTTSGPTTPWGCASSSARRACPPQMWRASSAWRRDGTSPATNFLRPARASLTSSASSTIVTASGARTTRCPRAS
jgi:aldehyde:ferredoxin oxidoreductase